MWTFNQVATLADLDEKTSKRFVTYMKNRWEIHETTLCRSGFANEWAMFFKAKIEYHQADILGQTILATIDCITHDIKKEVNYVKN